MHVVRVSLIPFDTGETTCSRHHVTAARMGWELPPDIPWDDQLVSAGLRVWHLSANSDLALTPVGLGVVVARNAYDVDLTDCRAVAQVLLDRAADHLSVHNGSHSACTTMREYCENLASAQSSRKDKRARRPEIWNGAPYIFSFYLLEGNLADLATDKDSTRALYALLEPSQVFESGFVESDGPGPSVDDVAYGILSLDPEEFLSRHVDIDLRPDTATFVSWAGLLVVHDGALEHAQRLYESLELRLQIAWSLAFLARSWSDSALQGNRDSLHLERFALEMVPLVRISRRVLDARVSSRTQQIMQALMDTSALEREVQAAEESIQDVNRRKEFLNNRARKRYDATVEFLLLLLAGTQVVPLVTDIPVVNAPPVAVLLIFSILITVGLLRMRRL